MDTGYRDEDTLERLYHDEGLDQKDIAERFGVKPNTISEWMSRHDITTRPHQSSPHKDESVLRYLYHDEGLSLREIGERFDKSRETIRHWMDKHDIERRGDRPRSLDLPEDEICQRYRDGESMGSIARSLGVTTPTIRKRLDARGVDRRTPAEATRAAKGEYVGLVREENGYLRWKDDISGRSVSVHRLTAIAHGADPHKVFSGEYHCHHRNGCRLDDRPANIEVLSNSEHMKLHRNGNWTTENGYPVLALPAAGEQE